jgi:ABC-type polysaccharide/polyol phosphate export permease
MMTVLTFVFARLFTNTKTYWVYVLSGLLPYNFFVSAWSAGAVSVSDNGALVKRVPLPRLILPISAVLAQLVHLAIQFGLFLLLVVVFARGANVHWLWLPLLFSLQIAFLIGLAAASCTVNVYVRDTRYIVDSLALVLFWLVPVFYPVSIIPAAYRDIYDLNPLTAFVTAVRDIIINGTAPDVGAVRILTLAAAISMAVGLPLFRRLENDFYKHI